MAEKSRCGFLVDCLVREPVGGSFSFEEARNAKAKSQVVAQVMASSAFENCCVYLGIFGQEMINFGQRYFVVLLVLPQVWVGVDALVLRCSENRLHVWVFDVFGISNVDIEVTD